MLQKEKRLRKKKEFDRVYKKGRSFKSNFFLLKALPNTKGPKFGFVISKKFGNAVLRNRAKRRAREIVKNILPEIGEAEANYIITIKNEAGKASYKKLEEDLVGLLKKAIF